MSLQEVGKRNYKPRYARSGQVPPGSDLDHDPRRVSPDPAGNRAQRRLAKKVGHHHPGRVRPVTSKKRAPAASAIRPAPPASGEPWTRNCPDCVPELWIQGGAWGWKAHRYALHQEGDDPGPMPGADDKRPPAGWEPWTEEQRAEFHRRRIAARRGQKHAPPRTPRPPGGHYPAGR